MNQFLHLCPWHFLNCCSSAETKSEWVHQQVSLPWLPKEQYLWLLLPSVSLSQSLCWFSEPEVMGIFLPSTGNLGWGAWCRTVISPLRETWAERYPSWFSTTTCKLGTSLFHISTPPSCLKCPLLFVHSYMTSVQLDSGDSQQWLFCSLVVLFVMVVKGSKHSTYLLCHIELKYLNFVKFSILVLILRIEREISCWLNHLKPFLFVYTF